MTAVGSAETGSTSLRQWKIERSHSLWKAGIAFVLVCILVAFVIWPGWMTTQAKPSIPIPPFSVLGIGFGDSLPDSDRNSASLSLNTRQAGPTLTLELEIEQVDEFKAKPVLVMSMDIGGDLHGCTGVGYSTKRDIAFEQLQPVSQAIVNYHWKEILSRRNLDDTPVSDIDVAARAQEAHYVEVQLETEPYQYTISSSDDKTPERKVRARRTQRECQFDMHGFWTNDGPFYGLSIPRMAVGYLGGETYNSPAMRPSLESKISDLGELSLTQSSSVPSSSDDGSPKWGESTTYSYGTEIGAYRIRDSRPVGVAFRSITRTQSDQESVFWAGVGIGLAGSLVVMMFPLLYDAAFVLTPRIRRHGRSAAVEEATQDDPKIEGDDTGADPGA